MATITIEMTIGSETQTVFVNGSDARAIQFLDDLRNLHYEDAPTRTQAGLRYLAGLKSGIKLFAKGLEQKRLDAAVAVATDLEGG